MGFLVASGAAGAAGMLGLGDAPVTHGHDAHVSLFPLLSLCRCYPFPGAPVWVARGRVYVCVPRRVRSKAHVFLGVRSKALLRVCVPTCS